MAYYYKEMAIKKKVPMEDKKCWLPLELCNEIGIYDENGNPPTELLEYFYDNYASLHEKDGDFIPDKTYFHDESIFSKDLRVFSNMKIIEEFARVFAKGLYECPGAMRSNVFYMTINLGASVWPGIAINVSKLVSFWNNLQEDKGEDATIIVLPEGRDNGLNFRQKSKINIAKNPYDFAGKLLDNLPDIATRYFYDKQEPFKFYSTDRIWEVIVEKCEQSAEKIYTLGTKNRFESANYKQKDYFYITKQDIIVAFNGDDILKVLDEHKAGKYISNKIRENVSEFLFDLECCCTSEDEKSKLDKFITNFAG